MSRYSDEYPLHQAAALGDVNRVDELLRAGEKINSRTRQDETPLMAAVRSRRLDVVQLVIAAKANLDAKDKASRVNEGRQTALHRAVRFGYLQIARALLDAGAKVDPISQAGHTPLVHACYGGNLEMVRLLLNHGANPNGADERSVTPLIAASTECTVAYTEKQQARHDAALEIARELLKRGADANRLGGGETPLHGVLSLALVRELLRAGADVNIRNAKGETPLIVCALAGSKELLQSYIDAGADVSAKSSDGATAMIRFFDRRPPEIELFEMLVNAGGDIDSISPGGLSLLDYYVWTLGRILRARESDTLRAKFYDDDFVEDRSRLIQFLKGKGAKSDGENLAAKKGKTKQKSG